MTINEAEDIGRELKTRATWRPPAVTAELLEKAAEAIEWLLTELEEAERYAGDFEWGAEP